MSILSSAVPHLASFADVSFTHRKGVFYSQVYLQMDKKIPCWAVDIMDQAMTL